MDDERQRFEAAIGLCKLPPSPDLAHQQAREWQIHWAYQGWLAGKADAEAQAKGMVRLPQSKTEAEAMISVGMVHLHPQRIAT